MICSSGRARGFAYRHPVRPALEVVSGRLGARRTHLSCRSPAFREKFWHPAQVDGGHGHGEYQLGTVEATQLQLPKRAVLLAVAEDAGGLAIQQPLGEDGDGGAVLGVRGLAGPEDVEVAER